MLPAPTTGLPDPTVCTVLRYLPAILSYVIETNLSPKLQFLTKRMGRDPAVEPSEFLHYVTFSLEGRIRLRHDALRERGRVGAHGWCLGYCLLQRVVGLSR